MQPFKEAITDERNQQDILLWLLVGSVISIVVLSFTALLISRAVDIGSVGTSLATIIGLGGVGYGVKRVGEKYGDNPPCDPH
jgi:hypothetical protein